jgi:hypothetical protein
MRQWCSSFPRSFGLSSLEYLGIWILLSAVDTTYPEKFRRLFQLFLDRHRLEAVCLMQGSADSLELARNADTSVISRLRQCEIGSDDGLV